MAHQAKIDAAAKAEADRIAAEKARGEEEAKVRAENARLQQEAAARRPGGQGRTRPHRGGA